MKYPGLLDQDISRIGLQESQMYNLISGKLVTEIVKTSLGPRGMEKIYIDILGEDTITSHGIFSKYVYCKWRTIGNI